MSTQQVTILVLLNKSSKESDLAISELHQTLSQFFSKFQMPFETVLIEYKQQNLKTLQALVKQSKSQYFVLINQSLTTPLGDCFKFLQELVANESVDLVLGDRIAKKQPLPKFQSVFQKIVSDKIKNHPNDIFCDFAVFKKKILNYDNESNKIHNGPFLNLTLYQLAQQQNLKSMQIPCHEIKTREHVPRHSFFTYLKKTLILSDL